MGEPEQTNPGNVVSLPKPRRKRLDSAVTHREVILASPFILTSLVLLSLWLLERAEKSGADAREEARILRVEVRDVYRAVLTQQPQPRLEKPLPVSTNTEQ